MYDDVGWYMYIILLVGFNRKCICAIVRRKMNNNHKITKKIRVYYEKIN